MIGCRPVVIMAISKNRRITSHPVFLQILALTGVLVVPAGAESGDTNRLLRTVTIQALVPAGSGPLYMAGNLPELGPWDPRKFAMNGHGSNRIAVLHLPAGTNLEFKFTLGSWDSVETTSSGDDVPNRTYTVPASGEATYVGEVAA